MKNSRLLKTTVLLGLIFVVMLVSYCDKKGFPDSIVRVVQNDSIIEINNGIVKSEILLKSSHVLQTFYAIKNGHWVLIAKSLYRYDDTGPDVYPLYAVGPKYANDFRLMVNEGLKSFKVISCSDEEVRILVSGNIGDHELEQIM